MSAEVEKLSGVGGLGAKRTGSGHSSQRIGPYILGKTLGAGSSGRVKLGTHLETGLKVAIKIISKDLINVNKDGTPLSEAKAAQLNKKLEREITIMKLIKHPNVMQLYDVYENEKELFLVLEHVEGGELFDYLVKRGRLPEQEAVRFFQQMLYGIDFCHRHLIAHRDLKPENLLLDKDLNIKIADFGMASLQPTGKLLETSCGSPHYACPEIIRGLKYDGGPVDIWSCGVILYALLTGNLPFDDENIRKLLQKVKTGIYHLPGWLSHDARDLISRMLTVEPTQRIKMDEIFDHNLLRQVTPGIGRLPSALDNPMTRTRLDDPSKVDLDLVDSLVLLGYGESQREVLSQLALEERNMCQVFYWLLHARKIESLEYYQNDDESVYLTSNDCSASNGQSTPRRRTNSFVSIFSTNNSRANLFVSSSESLDRHSSFARSKEELGFYPNLGVNNSQGTIGPNGSQVSLHGNGIGQGFAAVKSGAKAANCSPVASVRSQRPSISAATSGISAALGPNTRKASVAPKFASPLAQGATTEDDVNDCIDAAEAAVTSVSRAGRGAKQYPILKLAIPATGNATANTLSANNSNSEILGYRAPNSNSHTNIAVNSPQVEKLQTNLGATSIGSPRFHRRKIDVLLLASPIVASSPKKSWFANLFNFKPEVYTLIFPLEQDVATPNDVFDWVTEHLKAWNVQYAPRNSLILCGLRCVFDPTVPSPTASTRSSTQSPNTPKALSTATSIPEYANGGANESASPTSTAESCTGNADSTSSSCVNGSKSNSKILSMTGPLSEKAIRFNVDFVLEESFGPTVNKQVKVSLTLQQGAVSAFQNLAEHFKNEWQAEYDL